MSLLFIGFSSFTVALSGALVPGPLSRITVAESVKRDASAGPLIIIGHEILEISLITLIILGVRPFLTSPSVKSGISAMGVFLVFFGMWFLKEI